MFRLSHIVTAAALVAVSAAPASAATFEDLRSGGSEAASAPASDGGFRTTYQPVPAGQDLRSPDAIDAAQHRGIYEPRVQTSSTGGQDLRSPDAVDAAQHRGIYAPKPDGYVLNRGYGSPDAVDAARELPPVQIPVIEPSDATGFDWGDASIGAAGMIGLFGIAGASALMLTTRRRRRLA